MEPLSSDSIPQGLVRKLASYSRGPHPTPCLQRNRQLGNSHALQASTAVTETWAAECFTEVDTTAAAAKARVHATPANDIGSKYSVKFYAQHASHGQDHQDANYDADRVAALQQETLAMQQAFAAQQSALHSFTKCKVKQGLPFARPGLQHPKTVGAAKIVPNNRLKHPYAPPLTPDLTKDRPLVWPAHIPQPHTASVAHLDSTQRRQAAPRLHCRAFEFPANAVAGPEVLHGKVSKDDDACEVKIRPFQMLGSGFRLKRTVVCDIAS